MSFSPRSLLRVVLLHSVFITVTISTRYVEAQLQYRRIEIPQNRLEDFVSGLRPLSRDEFESLVAPGKIEPSTFASARYKATFDGQHFIQGTGTLELHERAKYKSSDGTDQFVPLSCNLAIHEARWNRGDSTQRAVLGQSGGHAIVLADARSQQLEIDWSFRGDTLTSETIPTPSRVFEIAFPDAFVQDFQIEAPIEFEFRSAEALVTRLGPKTNGNAKWSIRWSGHKKLRLSAAPVASRASLRANIESTYRIGTSELRADVELLLNGDPTSSVLILDVDSSLTVASVTSESKELLFTRSETDDNVILVELPDSDVNADSGSKINITAIGQFTLRETQFVPRIRPRCNWVSETIRCRIAPMLAMMDLRLRQCVCRSLAPQESSGSEWYTFDLESEFASIQFVLDQKPKNLSSEAIVALRMQDKSVSAQVAIRFQPRDGELFELEMDIDTESGWVLDVDSVEAIADVDTLPRFAMAARPRLQNGRLTVSLDQAATADRPVHVSFLLRNDSFSTATISADELLAVRVPKAADSSSWIYVEDTPGLKLAAIGAEHGEWQRSDGAQQLPRWIEELLGRIAGTPLPQDMFLRHTVAARLVGIRRTPVTTLPAVQSSTKVEFRESDMRYSLDVDVDPRGKEIDRIVVDFSESVSSDDWTLTGRAEIPELISTIGSDGITERHEVHFKPTSEPFQLHFEFQNNEPQSESIRIPLASIENTQGGAGSVGLIADGAIDLDIQPAAGLDAVPFSAMNEPIAKARKYRGVFRYDNTSTSIPSLSVARWKQTPAIAAWTWRTDLRSFYSEKGRPRHRADYFIQSEGSANFRLRFPGEYAIETVEVDGLPLDPQPHVTDSASDQPSGMAEVLIPIPSSNRYPCVTVKYIAPDRALRAIDRLTPPLPIADITSMQNTWQVWLPKDYRVYDPAQESLSSNSWLQRLVGYFGSTAAAEFETSILRSLRRQWVPHLDDPLGLIQQIEILLGPDWPVVSDANSEQFLRWGDRLSAITQTVRRSRENFEFVVDREELRRIGVFADTFLPQATATQPRGAGVDRLAQSGLVLVVEGRKALLTSTAAACLHTSKSDWVDNVSVDGKIFRFGNARLMSVDEWISTDLQRLWRPSRDELEIGLQQAGWAPSRRNLSTTIRPLKVYHRDTIVASACGLFCLGFALGWWLFQRQQYRRLGVFLASLALAATLLLPQPGATLACTFGWALLASGIVRVTAKSRRKQRLREPVIRRLSPTRAAVWLAVAFGIGIESLAPIEAQETVTAQDVVEQDEVFVYFPTDKDRKPTSVVYLPTEFYRTLKRQQSENEDRVPYLLSWANYTGTLTASDVPMRLTMNYEITSFVKNARFELPDYEKVAQVDLESIRINRQPGMMQTENGKSYLLLDNSGDHRVSFEVQIPWKQLFYGHRFDLPIPKSPVATLELSIPRSSPQVEVPTAIGHIALDSQRGNLTANLGPSSELSIVARQATASSNDLPQVDRIMRIHVGSEKAEIDVRFEFAETPIPLTLELDRRLIPTGDSARLAWDKTKSTLSHLIAPATRLRFELESPSGRFEIPEVKPRNAKVVKTRIAVSAGEQKTVRVDNAILLPTAPLAEEWSDVEEKPDFSFESQGNLPSLEVVDIPLLENWTSELSYFFDQVTTRVEVKAQLVPQYTKDRMLTVRRLRIPEFFNIGELTATSSRGVPQRLRWHRNGDEVAVFFLDELSISATSPLEINVRGRLTNGDQNLVALPVVELVSDLSENAAVRNVVNIYRGPDVDVIVIMEGMGPFVPGGVDIDTKQRDGYRLHEVWTSETVGFQSAPDVLTVRRQVLDRKITGNVTTRLIHEAAWRTEITTNLTSDQGIDVVYFDVPSSLCFQQPVAFEDQKALRVDLVQGGPQLDRRMIAVWLPEAPRKKQRQIRLVASLTQDRTSLPHVRLVNVALQREGRLSQHFVELPRRSNHKDAEMAFTWRRTGLSPMPADELTDSDYQRFRVSQPTYEALLEEQQSGLRPEISLLSTTVHCQETGSYVAMSEFDLKPARQARLLIALPKGAELIQVFCNDNHTMFTATNSNENQEAVYKFLLASTPWPQRVRVMFRGDHRHQLRQSGVMLEAPQLLYVSGLGQKQTISISKEIWSVDTPESFGVASALSSGDHRIDESDIDAARVGAFVELWNSVQASIRERPRAEKAACLANWAHYLAGPISRRPGDTSTDPNWQMLEDLIVEYAEAFTVNPESHAIVSADLWNESQWSNGNQARFISPPPVANELPTLALNRPKNRAGAWPRYCIACGLLAFGAFIPRWSAGSVVANRILDYPHAVVASLGVLWWLFLSPAWLGTLVVLGVATIWIWRQVRMLRLPSRR